jgi:hypothetical protein
MNRYLAKTDPAHYSANKAIMLGHGVQYRERPPGQQSKVSRISRNFDLDQSLEQTVKQARGRSLEPGFPLSDLTLAVHYSGYFVHPARHLVQQFRGILEVGIDDQNTLTARIVKACR